MRVLKIVLTVVLLSHLAVGCFMIAPPTKLEGAAVVGRFSFEGKPLRRSKIQLLWNGQVLATVLTDKNGNYRLPISAKGSYVIRMLNPSGESFQIDFTPNKNKQQIFKVDFFGDYCYHVDTGA